MDYPRHAVNGQRCLDIDLLSITGSGGVEDGTRAYGAFRWFLFPVHHEDTH